MKRAVADKPQPFEWRGVAMRPDGEGGYRSDRVTLQEYRTADWKAHQAGSTWYARLRVGADRFPGRGETAAAALDSAAAEARLVMRFIRAMCAGKGGA